MDGYIAKPINREELFTVIGSVLQSSRSARTSFLPRHDRQIPGNLPSSDTPPK
jgi:hypothetical protein